jgi:phage terminase small subunit
MLNNRNFHKPKKKKEMIDIDFFSHIRRVLLLEEEKVRIEDYNSKENRRVFRELKEKLKKNDEEEKEEDEEEYPPSEQKDSKLLILGTDRQLTRDI